MEVMVGSSFGIGRLAYVRDRSGVSAQDKAVQTALFLADESGRGGSEIGIGLRMSNNSKSLEESEDSSSSIGESSENEEDDEDDVVSSQRGTLDSFSSSLEDSLRIKRGLSNHYVGKSKSFGNLMESACSAKDLEKAENPFNKKRRLLIANKLRRRSMSVSNFYTWQNPNSIPLLVLQEQNQKDNDRDEDEDEDDHKKIIIMMKNKRELMAQTRSCFCLSSLQEEEDCDGDDEEDE